MLADIYKTWREKTPLWERGRETDSERTNHLWNKQRIRDLVNEYAFACDSRSWDVLRKIYHEDIERIMKGTLDEYVKGRDALIALHEKPALPRKKGSQFEHRDFTKIKNLEIRHLIGTLMTRISDDDQKAWALCHYQMALVGEENEEWEHGLHEGTYLFSFINNGDDWQFIQHLIWTNNAANPMFGKRAEK
ncbi:nuclear transport factor 2 family protein [Hyphococcus sp. DH-69]|uniref:nuclear transport factor 2 family protein n=1 Tax=Hyphococcus formosus TaxID=3143534 RepID=UPI00398AF4C2